MSKNNKKIEGGEKRTGRTVNQKCEWIIDKLKEEAWKKSELRETYHKIFGDSDRTFNRNLNIHVYSGVVKQDLGMLYFHEHYKEKFYSKEEYERYLEHSKKVLKCLPENGKITFDTLSDMMDTLDADDYKRLILKKKLELDDDAFEYFSPFKHHLKTGYPYIWGKYQEYERKKEEMEDNEYLSKHRVHEKAKEIMHDIEVNEIGSFKDRVTKTDVKLGNIRYTLSLFLSSKYCGKTRKDSEYLEKVKVVEGNTKYVDKGLGAEWTLGHSKHYKEIKAFLEKLIKDKEIGDLFKENQEIKQRLRNLNERARNRFKSIKMEVENGTTLKGRCKLCPIFEVEK